MNSVISREVEELIRFSINRSFELGAGSSTCLALPG
jgi:hypothetical protein